jgi:DNA methylase
MAQGIKQRADLTHKPNMHQGRHGWLRLTPAYSVRLVREIIDEYGYGEDARVLDPFAGTSTTPLVAAERGLNSVGVDINPFLTWFGNVKIARYGHAVQKAALVALAEVLESAVEMQPIEPPAIHNIERWWSEDVLSRLCSLRAAITHCAKTGSKVRQLLDVVFCRTMIEVSNAAFNHQSMSFADKSVATGDGGARCLREFQHYGQFVISTLTPDPVGEAEILYGDSRHLSDVVTGPFDLVVTSPPYANRMSYVRELRPYMYWLKYLTDARSAGELDWQAIGGTWGIATSRVADWEPEDEWFEPPYLTKAVESIARTKEKSGHVLSRYVRKYFYDIWHHILSLKDVMGEGGAAVYIVGNSTFYGVLVPTERVYADMLLEAGFERADARIIRKRNSKKELYEYAVEASLGTPKMRRRRRRQMGLFPARHAIGDSPRT